MNPGLTVHVRADITLGLGDGIQRPALGGWLLVASNILASSIHSA